MNILIADQQTLFSEGLQRIVREKYGKCRVQKADKLEEIVEFLQFQIPEIIFLNAYFIDFHFDTIRPLLGKTRHPSLIAICDSDDSNLRQNAASVGTVAVLNKSASNETIWKLISDCHQQTFDEREMRLVENKKNLVC